MVNNFDRSKFLSNIKILDLPQGVDNKMAISKYLLGIEKEYKIDKVFCVFGPSYYKSMVPKVVGYAIPHYIYPESPFLKNLSIGKKFLHAFLKRTKVYLFKKKSDALIIPSIPMGLYIEATSLSMLESMYLGIPVLASRIGRLAEVISDRKNAIIF